MTAFATAAAAIRAKFENEWVSAPGSPRTPIAWQNIPYQPPDGAPWVYFEVLFAGAFQASTGAPSGNLYRHAGVIQIHAFTPIGEGSASGFTYADHASAIFRGQNFSGVLCRAPRVQPNTEADGDWFRVTVQVPFDYDAAL
ncbi:MAG: phage tail terminator-like protein [Pseudomonadota bacterium]